MPFISSSRPKLDPTRNFQGFFYLCRLTAKRTSGPIPAVSHGRSVHQAYPVMFGSSISTSRKLWSGLLGVRLPIYLPKRHNWKQFISVMTLLRRRRRFILISTSYHGTYYHIHRYLTKQEDQGFRKSDKVEGPDRKRIKYQGSICIVFQDGHHLAVE